MKLTTSMQITTKKSSHAPTGKSANWLHADLSSTHSVCTSHWLWTLQPGNQVRSSRNLPGPSNGSIQTTKGHLYEMSQSESWHEGKKIQKKLKKFLVRRQIGHRIRLLKKVRTWIPKHTKQLVQIDNEITNRMLKAEWGIKPKHNAPWSPQLHDKYSQCMTGNKHTDTTEETPELKGRKKHTLKKELHQIRKMEDKSGINI